MKASVLTFSDRSARGERKDVSGPLIIKLIEASGWSVSDYRIIPDDRADIEKNLMEIADQDEVDLILTTGGTGMAPRDCAPEATAAVIDRPAPGFAEAMRIASLKITPHAMLSRATAGIRGKVLIINLPGSPKAARENLQVILPTLKHAIELLREDPAAEDGHQFRHHHHEV